MSISSGSSAVVEVARPVRPSLMELRETPAMKCSRSGRRCRPYNLDLVNEERVRARVFTWVWRLGADY